MFRRRKSRLILAFSIALAGAPICGAVEAKRIGRDVSLDALLDVLDSGDQKAFERYIAKSFDPKALRTSSAAERADRLARLFVDSGGFSIKRRVRTTGTLEIATAQARVTRLPSCLTLKIGTDGGRKVIEDFSVSDLPLPASPVLSPPDRAEVSKAMAPFMDRLARSGRFSGVILLAEGGRPFFHRAYGRADVAGKVPIRVDTRFNIASIGKSLTAVVIGQLLDEGHLSLEDKVGKFLPGYPDLDVRKKVTVRHLLTHTSGLGAKSEFTNNPLWRKAAIRSIDDYIPLIIGPPLESEPGSRYSYSNAGFVILGKIIESVSGRSFYEVVQHRVFERAAMHDSFYGDPVSTPPRVATALTSFVFEGSDYVYRLGARLDASRESAIRGGSHGGAFLTAADLLRFINAVRGGSLTSPTTARLLTSPQGAGRLPGTQNGLGFEIAAQNGHTILGHTGGDIGVSAFVYHFEPTGYTAIVLSNRDPRAIRAIARKSRAIVTRSTIGGGAQEPKTDCDIAFSGGVREGSGQPRSRQGR